MIPSIKKLLSLRRETSLVSESANRSNIIYITKDALTAVKDTFHWITDELMRDQDKCRKIIIYCRSVKAVGTLFSYFMDELGQGIYVGKPFSANRLVAMYHRVTPTRMKKMVASNFHKLDSVIRVVLATLAFGMGIDCPDVFLVINWGAPTTSEGF